RALASWERVVPDGEIIASHLAEARDLARRLGMAEGPEADRLSAGIGPIEPAPAPRQAPSAPIQPPSVKSKPAPGLRETRVRERKTGEALKELFPGIFEPESPRG